MAMPIQTFRQMQLEQLVDETSFAEVVERLAQIAYAKAEHVQSNWQDDELARHLNHIGRVLSKVKLPC